MIRWNLGSCDRHFPGYLAVDLCPPADIIADLAGPWPAEDSTVHEIRAWDIIEHIGDCDHVSANWYCARCFRARDAMTLRTGYMRNPFAQIHVMNEAWRVLVPGGKFDIEVPTTDGRGAWQDPTHRSYWNLNSFKYFTAGDPHLTRFAKHYGTLASFKVLNASQQTLPEQVTKLKIILEAVK